MSVCCLRFFLSAPDNAARRVDRKEEELNQRSVLMTGRQVLFVIIDWYRVTAADGARYDFNFLQNVSVRNGNLDVFLHEWDTAISGLGETPAEYILESLFYNQVRHHPELRPDIAYFDRLPQGHMERNYSWLYDRVEAYLERVRIQHARNQLDGGHRKVLPVQKDSEAVPKGYCKTFWNTGKCPSIPCPWPHKANPTLVAAGNRSHKANDICCRDLLDMASVRAATVSTNTNPLARTG